MNAELFLYSVDMIFGIDVEKHRPELHPIVRYLSESETPTGFMDEADYGDVALVLENAQYPVAAIADLGSIGTTEYAACNINVFTSSTRSIRASKRDKATWWSLRSDNRHLLPQLKKRVCEVLGLAAPGRCIITSGPDICMSHNCNPSLKLILFKNGWVCVVAVHDIV